MRHSLRHGLLTAALVLAPALGCSTATIRAQASAANQVAIAANIAMPRVVEIYQEAGLALIASSPTRAVAEERLAELIEEWTPVWGTCGMILEGSPPQTLDRRCTPGAWNVLETAHAAWADLLERHLASEPVTVADFVSTGGHLHDAYCTLRAVLASRHPLPDVPVMRCPALPAADAGTP